MSYIIISGNRSGMATGGADRARYARSHGVQGAELIRAAATTADLRLWTLNRSHTRWRTWVLSACEAPRALTGLPLWEAVFSPDFEWLIARTGGTTTIPGGRDVWAVRPDEDTTTIPLVVTGFDEKAIALSPDGGWLAYESDETGRNEIYVRPFPDIEAGKWQVSTGGGVMPVWAHTNNELFYVNGANEMVAVQIRPGTVTSRTVLFTMEPELLFRQGEQYSLYDVTPDDSQFIMMRAVNLQVSEPDLIYVENWSEELKARTQRD